MSIQPFNPKGPESEAIARHIAEFGEHRIQKIPRGVSGITEKRTHAGLTTKQRDLLSKERQKANRKRNEEAA